MRVITLYAFCERLFECAHACVTDEPHFLLVLFYKWNNIRLLRTVVYGLLATNNNH
jgi:hypothetical protein